MNKTAKMKQNCQDKSVNQTHFEDCVCCLHYCDRSSNVQADWHLHYLCNLQLSFKNLKRMKKIINQTSKSFELSKHDFHSRSSNKSMLKP